MIIIDNGGYDVSWRLQNLHVYEKRHFGLRAEEGDHYR